MQGLSLHGVKKHPSLIPIFCVTIFGFSTGIFFGVRAALKSPDVTWSQKKNPEPWQEYANKKYKLLDPAEKRNWHDHPRRLKSLWD